LGVAVCEYWQNVAIKECKELTDIRGAEIAKYKAQGKTDAEIKEYLSTISGVALGSDAFFPFDDNIERAYRSGVSYIAEPGGSIRDDAVIDCCNKYDIAMAFTGMRLFHH
jgi:phosphoribosylaminoimidazolecarboxamide formyltransferase/IMP cyclohydrolase